jgi:outer membrane protein assembly factor BamB
VFIGLDKNPSSPQDRVPALGVASGRKWLWQADLASSVGETARWLDPPLAVVRSDTLVVPYVTTEGAKLAAFTLPTGKLVWAQALPKVAVDDTGGVGSQRTAPELSISLARRIFYRTQEGRLWVLNLDSGILEWSLGDQ